MEHGIDRHGGGRDRACSMIPIDMMVGDLRPGVDMKLVVGRFRQGASRQPPCPPGVRGWCASGPRAYRRRHLVGQHLAEGTVRMQAAGPGEGRPAC
jgi:hypothetical protein